MVSSLRDHGRWIRAVVAASVAIAGLLLVVLGTPASSLAKGARAAAQKTLKVSLVTDLTGTNTASRKPFNEGVVSFFKSYPTAGNGKFAVQLYDGQSNPAVAPLVFRQATGANPIALIDFTLSTSTAAAEPIIASAGVPCLCVGGPDNWYTPKPLPYMFLGDPTGFEDAEAYELAAQKMMGGKLKGKRIAISGDSTAIFTTILTDLKYLAKRDGWTVSSVQMGPFTEVTWASEAAAIAQSKPNAVIDLTIGTPQVVQIKAMESAGLSNTPLIAFPGLQYSDLTSLKLHNVYIVSAFPYGTARSTGLFKAAQKYGYLSDETSFEFAFGWTQAAILRAALVKCHDCTGTKLEAALQSVHNYKVPGGAAFGTVGFSRTSHSSNLKQEILVYDPSTNGLRILGVVSPALSTR